MVFRFFLYCYIGGLFVSCKPVLLESRIADLSPPEIISVQPISGKEFRINFDKTVLESSISFVEPSWGEFSTKIIGSQVVISTEKKMLASLTYKVYGKALGESNNELRFLIRYFPLNEALPPLILNEVRTDKSSKGDDAVELYALADGNIAGYTLYFGSKENFKNLFRFPSVTVKKGDFIVVHYKKRGESDEKNELLSLNSSKASTSSDLAWDFWLDTNESISKNNGILSLYDRYDGKIIDLFVYSERKSQPFELKLGWTNSLIESVKNVSGKNEWNQEGETILPEEAFYSGKTTGTRSMNRNLEFLDTNNSSDWHLVDTSQASIGYPNSDKMYIP